MKHAYDECFSSECEPPYNLFLNMRDGSRQKLDLKLNRKLNKQYDMNNVVLMEAEFLISADFVKVRAEFTKVLNQPFGN